jgi:hypothetical protein
MPPTNRRRTTNRMRNARGMQLVEMVVALGLSGVFIVLLSQMMSENMRLGTATATDQMATAALDSLEENMLNMPYAQVDAPSLNEQMPVVFENDADRTILQFSKIRKIAMQQRLGDQSFIWGGFNPFTKQIDLTNCWKKDSAPYFRGTIYKSVSLTTLGALPAKKVTLTLQLNNKNPGATGVRTRIREFFILENAS